MLSLSNLLADGSDPRLRAPGEPEAAADHREVEEQGRRGKNLKANYKFVPSGAYLHAALREETHN